MKKIVIEGIGIIVLFFFTWFALSEVDWMTLLKFEKLSKISEKKLGELFWDVFQHSDNVVSDYEILSPIDSLVNRICDANDFDKESLKIHIVTKDEVNAFALPDEHLIIYTGLIENCENPSELVGVICHEIAHMKSNHIMKKLGKEIGLTALISISSGNSGSEIAKQAAKILSSTAYDRKLEKEADIKAADYLINAKISSVPFANFLFRLSNAEPEINSQFSWISTHPDSKTRAEYLMQYRKGEPTDIIPVLSNITWEKIQKTLQEQ